jgi:hypothetical protein
MGLHGDAPRPGPAIGARVRPANLPQAWAVRTGFRPPLHYPDSGCATMETRPLQSHKTALRAAEWA